MVVSLLDGLRPFLNVLHQPGDGLVEWRAINRDRHPAVVRGWVPVGDHDGLLSVMVDHGDDRDFYVGAAPRERMAGGKDAVPFTRVLWADLDTPAARGRLAEFKPVPSMIVHSGGGAHAYWELREPAAAAAAEPVLRRLAAALEADKACAEVARVLRPPGSLNHKTQPARPVRLIGMTGARYSLDELAAGTLS